MTKIRGIKGFLGVSLVDYPGEVSSVIFLGGCNFSCSYCHNMPLVKTPHLIQDLNYPDIFKEIEENKKVLDGIVLSGGEPTIAKDLFKLLCDLKKLHLKIKLDTNGLRTEVLEKVVERRLVDYVAMDLKTSPDKYRLLGCPEGKEKKIVSSVSFLKSQKIVDYELRTTFVPQYVNKFSFEGMKPLIDGVKAYYLQGTVGTDLWKAKEFADLVRSQCLVGKFGTRNFNLRG